LVIVDQVAPSLIDDSQRRTLLFVPSNVKEVVFAPVQTVCPPFIAPGLSSNAILTKTAGEVFSQVVTPLSTFTL